MEDHDPLTYDVIGAAIEVHKVMGPGLLESVYQSCMEEELKLRKIEYLTRYRIPLVYKSIAINQDFVIDLLLPGLIVELKAVEKLLPVHEAQLLTYLKLKSVRVGLLINFNVPVLRNGIKRMVL